MKQLAVPLAIGLSLSVLSAPVLAKSTIGGIVFVNTYNSSQNDNLNSANDLSSLTLANAGNSRLRIKWNNEDRVSMYYELALKGSGVTVRHAYGKWDFSETGQILAGQTSTPFAPLNANVAMVNNSGEGYGRVSPGRQSQIRYTYKFLNRDGAIAVALVNPNKGSIPTIDDDNNPTTDEVAQTREQSLPRLDVGMAYSKFNWQIFPSFFYHEVEFAGGAQSITSNGIAFGFRTAAGPVTFEAELGAGKNWGNTAGSYGSNSIAGARSGALYNGGVLGDDNDNTAYYLDVGYRFTGDETKGVIHFLYGAMTSQSSFGGTVIDAMSTMYGISMPIDMPYIARGFRIRPELFVFEDEDTGTNVVDKSDTIVGVQLQYTF